MVDSILIAYSIALTCLSVTQAIVQLIDSSESADTLFFKSAPEWDLNKLPLDYESEVQTTTLSLHYWFMAV